MTTKQLWIAILNGRIWSCKAIEDKADLEHWQESLIDIAAFQDLRIGINRSIEFKRAKDHV